MHKKNLICIILAGIAGIIFGTLMMPKIEVLTEDLLGGTVLISIGLLAILAGIWAYKNRTEASAPIPTTRKSLIDTTTKPAQSDTTKKPAQSDTTKKPAQSDTTTKPEQLKDDGLGLGPDCY